MAHGSFAFYLAILRKNFVAYCTEKISDLGVTYSQLFVLIYIGKGETCSSKEIAEYLKLDAGQLNRTVTKLIEKGLVTQRKNSRDRRFNSLSLTESGLKTVEQSRGLFHAWDEEVLSGIDEGSRQELMALMQNLVLKVNEKQKGKQNEPTE